MSRRTERIASSIQREVSLMIQREIQDPRVPTITSVTRVKVSDDLSVADVYVSMMASPGEQTAGLNALMHSAGMMRSMLTKALQLRVAPYLRFHIDDHLKKEMAVLDALHQIELERQAREGEPGGPPPGNEEE